MTLRTLRLRAARGGATLRANGLATVVLLLAGAGCASQPAPLYRWNGYEEALYRHYRSPQEREAWVGSLRRIVLEADRGGRRAPPGIHAEYGFALYEEGALAEAISYFEREKAAWPESTFLMDKMIRNAQRRMSPGQTASPARGPAGSLERAP